jgi:flavin-dependent dehydrogenase
MYDAIVIGARCAGAPLAMLLARSGGRILLVDRATFPSNIPHGHFIHRQGPRRLRQWGLLDPIAQRVPAIDSGIFDAGDFPLRARDLTEDGMPWAFGPRRTTLDTVLVDAAVASGVELREAFAVTGFVFEGGRVAGIRGRGTDGRVLEERATITVGADGRNSRLAQAVDAPIYNALPTILCYYFSYWSGVDGEPFELYVRPADRRVIFSFKTEDDLFAVFVGAPSEELPSMRADVERAFMQTLDLVPGLSERVRAGHREERFYGASDLPNFYRKPYGDGWALVGDAGLHKDPFLALGICDALRDVELLARAIGEGLNGVRRMEDALGDYEAARNAATAADYEENVAAARFAPLPPKARAIRAAVKDKPAEATRFIKARMQMIDPAAFFAPEHLQQLLS